ncbi:MAG: DUF3306 domain-containing protein [Leptothrix sp. (in: Bacteria)]|nr:DUF3306 domain-containing protein [Leptothrix sp. (in: b-proteobacteria)]
MSTDSEDSGFLSRWSRRKAQVRQGADVVDVARPPTQPATVTALADPLPAVDEAPPREAAAPEGAQPSAAPGPRATPSAAAPAPPTLDDVAALTRESDYSRFVGRSVQPDVRNAALGKLFSDPHFNVMDGLDTYIDDYGIPDPLPDGMLRKMLQAQAMGLFAEEQVPPTTPPPAPELAPQPEAAVPTPPELAADENTDLQLQPDDDAGCPGPAPGAGEDAGRAL